MSYLQKSTHFNNWIFTNDELDLVNQLRMHKVTEQFTQMRSSGKDIASYKPKPRAFACMIPQTSTLKSEANNELALPMETDLSPTSLDLLTIEEEDILKRVYEVKVQESCTILFRTSDKVKSSAVMFYKRFYLSNSIMEFHPKHVVPTVIYLAGKVEEQYINVDTICEHLKVDHKIVIAYETIVLQGLNFQLIMYHPFRSLLGFIEDARIHLKIGTQKASLDGLQKIHEESVVLISKMILTNVPLHFNPPYIALYALRESARATKIEGSNELVLDMDAYLISNETTKGTIDKVELVLSAIHECMQVEQKKQNPSNVKSLYKKLKTFHIEEPSTKDGGKEPKKKKHKKEHKKSKH